MKESGPKPRTRATARGTAKPARVSAPKTTATTGTPRMASTTSTAKQQTDMVPKRRAYRNTYSKMGAVLNNASGK